MKRLLLGNEAVARGVFEAGVKMVSSYPGTPSTEITEYVSNYKGIECEWAPNEKVAVEAAIGASIAGARSFSAMKHVGLNVAADPLFTSSYIGINGGMVIAVADDPGMHSSQNEQDSRHYAIAAKLPMFEPSDSKECKEFTKIAYDISEIYDTPVLIRLTTRVAHSRSVVEISDREELELLDYVKDTAKNVMLPVFARQRHALVEERMKKLSDFAEIISVNSVEYNDRNIGIIAAGDCYNYAKEVMGDKASYLKLGMINPLPVKYIKNFADEVDKLYVIEELDDIIETHCRKNGIKVIGKEVFSRCGEISPKIIREILLKEKLEYNMLDCAIPNRPATMCCGCPHRGLFYALKKEDVFVSGDIGCYTLGALSPLFAMDTCICMGSSISSLHGFNKVRKSESESKSVAVIGDSTFMHSGITGLIDVVYNSSNSVIIILDNSITGMTGHQQNPTTGYNIRNEVAVPVDIEGICRAIGVKRVVGCDPYDLEQTISTIKKELDVKEPSVIISRRPCALLNCFKRETPLSVAKEKCVGCKSCLNIGCPAISFKSDKAFIDKAQCVGCNLCKGLCKMGAIVNGGTGNE